MSKCGRLRLFISYSHKDEAHIGKFFSHIDPLIRNGLIEEWYDRKIIAGKDFQNDIDNNLENADVICLFISANFLSSNACQDEIKTSFSLKRAKGIEIVPIILSACAWKENKYIKNILAIPQDGKEIAKFEDEDEAWHSVYFELKKVIENVIKICGLKLSDEFISFLRDADLLTEAHSQKNKVQLDDIYVYPELDMFDDLRGFVKKINGKSLIKDFFNDQKILIAGENQSGKTSLCKQLFKELRSKNLIPIYVSERPHYYQGIIENIVQKSFSEQYQNGSFTEFDNQKIVPILDNFHLAKNKEKHLQELSKFPQQVVIVDDIFSFNFKDENLINSFSHFRIKEFIPSLRYQLIKQWSEMTDTKGPIDCDENLQYRCIDSKIDLVNSALGKILGSGIMPAFPFFILTVISTYETFQKPLDQEITSQGYCYQALIYLYLRKQGVRNDDIDTYFNFVTEFAFYIHLSKKSEISSLEFDTFMSEYLDKFNFPVKKAILLQTLQHARIIKYDTCGNYSFHYQYIYYYFVAKHIAEHIDDNNKLVELIIGNLHKDENAYIAIFISHHSKNNYILDELIVNALVLFDRFRPATLSQEELRFFDKQKDIIVKASLPSPESTPERERAKQLKNEDFVEQDRENNKNNTKSNNDMFELERDIRRSIKTVEVMGRIVKNRAGSLEKDKLEYIFEEALNVHLRVLGSFFDLIKKKNEQNLIINYISKKLSELNEEKIRKQKEENKKPRPLSLSECEKIANIIFWNLNFFVIYAFIDKIIRSLGSDKITSIVEKVCDNVNTPASFLVKHGIFMWHNKNLQVDNIAKKIEEVEFSQTSKKVLEFLVVNHCAMHSIGFKDKQRIESKLGIPSREMLIKQTAVN